MCPLARPPAPQTDCQTGLRAAKMTGRTDGMITAAAHRRARRCLRGKTRGIIRRERGGCHANLGRYLGQHGE